MDNHNEIKLFEGKKVRSVWNEDSGDLFNDFFPVNLREVRAVNE